MNDAIIDVNRVSVDTGINKSTVNQASGDGRFERIGSNIDKINVNRDSVHARNGKNTVNQSSVDAGNAKSTVNRDSVHDNNGKKNSNNPLIYVRK